MEVKINFMDGISEGCRLFTFMKVLISEQKVAFRGRNDTDM